MNLWMINHHALTPDMSGGTRHYDFAKELVKRGHEVTIIAASFHYAKFEEMKVYEENQNYLQEKIDGINFIWFKTPSYRGNGFGRVKNMLSFMLSVIKTIPKLNLDKPDTILGSSVHLFAVYAAYKLSLRYKSRFVMEVRDLWPQTLIDMGMSKWHPFIIFLGWLEKFLYTKADKVITNLPKAHLYIKQFVSSDNISWISNGVDISNIQYSIPKKKDTLIVAYTGAIGEANNIKLLVNVAKELKDNKYILFKIVGNGTEKEKLIAKVKELELNNVEFINPVPKNQISDILSSADVLFFNLTDSPVFKYGISSNKLFDYMASGRIVVFSANSPNNPIKEADGGFSINPESIDELKDVILEIYALSLDERIRLGSNNRSYVKNTYSIPVLVDSLENSLREKNV